MSLNCKRRKGWERARRRWSISCLQKKFHLLISVIICYTNCKVISFAPHPQPKISSPIYYLNKDGSSLSNRSKVTRKTLKEIQNDLKNQIIALKNFDQQQFSIESQEPVFLDMESNILNAIWGSKSVSDVKRIIDDVIQTAKYIIGQVSQQAKVHQPGPLDEYELLGPNIASAALRRVLDLRPDFDIETVDESNVLLAREMVPRLLNVVGRQILTREGGEASTLSSLHSQDQIYSFAGFMSSLTQWLGISPSSIFRYEITSASKANFFCSLAKIELLHRRSGYAQQEESRLAVLAKKVCRQTLYGDYGKLFVQEVKPVLLLETLLSLATFNLQDETNILHMIGDRLHQGDATGQLNGRQLSQGLWAFAVLNRPHLLLLKSFTRRLRKSGIRKSLTSSDITRAVWSAGRSLEQQDLIVQNKIFDEDANDLSDEDIGFIREEIVVMIYTLSNELLEVSSSTGGNKLHSLSARQVADLLFAFSIGEFESEVHSIVNDISKYIRDGRIFQKQVTTTDIARILWSFQRLKLDCSEATVHALVQKFVELQESKNDQNLTPKTLNTILRSIVFLLPDHGKSLQNLHRLSSRAILKKSFLRACNEFECSNFAFFLAMSNLYDKETIKMLANRMKDEDVIKSCTPSSASRFLWSFTKLVESNEEDLQMKEILFEMFRDLGGILLSMQLTPVDASSAMWAIAKSSYSLDMGIFDHLAEFLTQQCMMKAASIQQITEALWSCGKIYKWDWEAREIDKAASPPYIRSAKTFASFLVSQRSKMTPKDISQAILSLGHLQICDDNIVKPFAYKAIELADEAKFNSQELANIVWALSKVNLEDAVVFSHLTTQLCTENIMNQCSPQEAANVLYALGKMKIRDKDTFGCMTRVIMQNVDKTTTQAIANALWAHECVNLTPDRQFFDSWALEKLNIVGLYIDNQEDNV